MKPLTGREASVLALLAQTQGLSAKEKGEILATLHGQARRIAGVLVGQPKNATAADRAAAKGFTDWARGLSARVSA